MISIRRSAFAFFIVALSGWSQTRSSQLPAATPIIADGNYVGLEPMQSDNPHEPDALWYHENKLIVRSGELILDKEPISIQNGKKSYSASDGGFITYRGRFLTKNGRFYISLRPFMSDYYFFPIGPNSCEPYSQVDIFPIKVTNQGFWVNGVLYSRLSIKADRLKALEEMLNSEPLTYDGKHPYNSKSQMPACQPNDLSALDD